MRGFVREFCYLGSLALLLALMLAASPLFAWSVGASQPTPRTKNSVQLPPKHHLRTGLTKGYVNVRSQASANGKLLATYPPGTKVTIYSAVSGQPIWYGDTGWDRISKPGSPPRYIYGPLISVSFGHKPAKPASAKAAKLRMTTPSPRGKEIVISISRQWMFVYDKGKRIYSAPVTTGQRALSTPTGTYHVLAKLSPTTFYSPWPPGSPYWYPATHINYALQWKEGGFFLHDSWWRTLYGPGTNVYHYDPVDGWMSGTHGCITMPLSAATWLYKWAPIGTTVHIDP
jgi:lipoprotein-anchoring transpeptidase ErfK/SrfK